MDFRGWPENRSVLGVSGIRTRYQADGYDSIQREWTQFAGIVKLSGTTMMSKSLLPSQVYSNIHLRRFFVMKVFQSTCRLYAIRMWVQMRKHLAFMTVKGSVIL